MVRTKYFSIISLLFIFSCEYLDPTRKYIQIDCNSEFNLNIDFVKFSNGFILNDKYSISGVYLLENDSLPKWIFDNKKMIEIPSVDENGELLFSIWNLRPPYQIIKKRNSNIMLIVKENDTIETFMPQYKN